MHVCFLVVYLCRVVKAFELVPRTATCCLSVLFVKIEHFPAGLEAECWGLSCHPQAVVLGMGKPRT